VAAQRVGVVAVREQGGVVAHAPDSGKLLPAPATEDARFPPTGAAR
jgi:hypothetical protein